MSVSNAWGAWSLIHMGEAKFSLPHLRIIKGNSVSQVLNIRVTSAVTFLSHIQCGDSLRPSDHSDEDVGEM